MMTETTDEAAETTETPAKPMLNNSAYNFLKFVALVALPAVGSLYFGLAGIWDLPKANEVVGTITLIDTFLGVVLNFAAKSYNNSDAKFDGAIHVVEDTEKKKSFLLQLKGDPEKLDEKQEVLFKIEPS